MFDIGWSELVVIAVVALIAIGPKELPGVLRSAGYWMGKVRRMASDFQAQFQEAMREAEMADLKSTADDLNEAAKSLTSQFNPLSDFEKSSVESTASETTAAAATPETEAGQAETPAEPTAEPVIEPAMEPSQAPVISDPASKGAA